MRPCDLKITLLLIRNNNQKKRNNILSFVIFFLTSNSWGFSRLSSAVNLWAPRSYIFLNATWGNFIVLLLCSGNICSTINLLFVLQYVTITWKLQMKAQTSMKLCRKTILSGSTSTTATDCWHKYFVFFLGRGRGLKYQRPINVQCLCWENSRSHSFTLRRPTQNIQIKQIKIK